MKPNFAAAIVLLFACASRSGQVEHTPTAPAAENAAPSPHTAPDTADGTPLSVDECRSRAGEVLTDKGDGALHRDGCPDGRQQLGKVRVGLEGGLCCALAATTSAPPGPPSGKRAPCTTDQSCNEDETVSSLWGKCSSLGVCECRPGFELNPKGRCQKSVQ